MEDQNQFTALLFQGQSTLIVILMFAGVYFRKIRNRHVKIMSTVIIWDVLLILQIELNRSAIAKAADAVMEVSNKMILNIHVSIAVATVILYVFMVITGRKILKEGLDFKPKHKMLAFGTVTMRVLTYVTSFMVV